MKASQPLALAAAVALAGASVLGVSTAASAHNFVVSTTPAEGSTLTMLPAQFEVTTNDDLLDVTGNADAFVLDIVDSDGLYYGDGCVTVNGPTMATDAALGAAGTYTVTYQLVSADGHTIAGEYAFEWAPAAGEPVSTGWDTAPECGVERVTEPSPEPTAEPSTDPSEEPSASAEPENPAQGGVMDDLLWIGGVVAAIAVAVVLALVMLRRRN